MIFGLIARHAAAAERESSRYAYWREALRRFDADGLSSEVAADVLSARLRASWRDGRGMLLDEAIDDDLIEDEFVARHTLPHGDMPSIDEYECRFPGRCAALRVRGVDRFVLIRRLGGGAEGAVWEACDLPNRRAVAIKFASGLRVTGVTHPAIAGIEEVTDTYGLMPLARGRTLTERIAEGAPGLLDAFLVACDAVAFAHERGVRHGDLKPGNILVADDGAVAVIDWGARATPAYAAPEGPCDIFSLGMTLQEISPRALKRVWRRAAAPRPGDRYASVRALAGDVAPPADRSGAQLPMRTP